jgi:hypothetical protein
MRWSGEGEIKATEDRKCTCQLENWALYCDGFLIKCQMEALQMGV